MDGILMYVGRKKYRSPSRHQSDRNMSTTVLNQFTEINMHTHSYTHTRRTQLEHTNPAV